MPPKPSKPQSRPSATKPTKGNAIQPNRANRTDAASRLIDQRICELRAGDGAWRGDTLAGLRALILAVDPEIIEQWKWNVPVWSHPRAGIICTGETYARTVKLTFAKGARLADPARLFNSSLTGSTRRAIDIREGEQIDPVTFKALIRTAVGVPTKPTKGSEAARAPAKLLSGGNPQIAKGYGQAPVRAYIAAMPGWKRRVGRRVDAIVSRAVPGVRKAVKWNSPLYGVEEGTWFMSMHCFDHYVKVAFFRGAALRPMPPGKSKQKHVRYFDIREDDALDETQFADWVTQAAALPGEKL